MRIGVPVSAGDQSSPSRRATTGRKEPAMGIYREKVLPRIVDKACGMQSAARLRARVCAGLHGQVLEVGFGSGLNAPFYPAAVTGVVAIEPSDLAWRLAGDRVAASTVP